MYTLYARAGWGSALIETQLAWYGLPYRLEGIGDLFKEEAAGEKLRPVNPLMQLPTLVLPDGQIMTESAAITALQREDRWQCDGWQSLRIRHGVWRNDRRRVPRLQCSMDGGCSTLPL
jgi:hypothetical protein